MGAWRFVLATVGCGELSDRFPLSVVSRPESASPATGSDKAHKLEQAKLMDEAFTAGEVRWYPRADAGDTRSSPGGLTHVRRSRPLMSPLADPPTIEVADPRRYALNRCRRHRRPGGPAREPLHDEVWDESLCRSCRTSQSSNISESSATDCRPRDVRSDRRRRARGDAVFAGCNVSDVVDRED